MRWAPLLLISLALCACSNDVERDVRDTEGRTFHIRCPSEGRCDITQQSGEAWPGETKALVFHASSRFVGVCNVVGTGFHEAKNCRPLVCEKNSDCPPAHGMKNGSCVEGFCTDPSQDITQDDAVMHCLAGTGVGTESPRQIERFAMGLNCGTPCAVPKPCSKN